MLLLSGNVVANAIVLDAGATHAAAVCVVDLCGCYTISAGADAVCTVAV